MYNINFGGHNFKSNSLFKQGRWPNMNFCYYYLHYLISKGTQIKEVRRIKKKRDDLSPYNIQLDITTGGSNLKPIWNWYVVFEL